MTARRLDTPPATPPRQPVELTEGECWQLLRAAPLGRVVFTHRAMPAIRPVNHLVDGRTIIIRTHLGAAIASRARGDLAGYGQPSVGRTQDGRAASHDGQGGGQPARGGQPPGSVVCYEADDFDPVRHTGWSVIVTGLARLVDDPADIARYSAAVQPWIAGDTNQLMAIEARFVSGLRLVGWCG